MRSPQLLFGLLLLALAACEQATETIPIQKEVQSPLTESGAGQSLDFWGAARGYPSGTIPTQKFVKAFEAYQEDLLQRNDLADWESLGPDNVGGRMLDLAFHPTDTNLIFAGSASGGLWKTNTAGKGAEAWEPVPTGFPVLAVSKVAIAQTEPEVMFIGTGEVYGAWENTMPGVITNGTRGTYGIGILKTSDGGLTWEKSLDLGQTDLEGVWDVVFNPQNERTLFAATSRGLWRSYDQGDNWTLIEDTPVAIDIEINPADTNDIFVSFGNMNPFGAFFTGTLRSQDGGQSFALVEGLPNGHSGKTMISFSQSDPNVIYVSAHEAFDTGPTTDLGLFKSEDGGETWENVNNTGVPRWQGWYANDVAVHPGNPDTLINGGIEVWKSVDGGESLVKKSNWLGNFTGQVQPEGPEGTPIYVHADIHGIYYHPLDPQRVFIACDGGMFESIDGGESWSGRNGGFQTAQFYADFANSTTDADFAIGGLQDNNSAIYRGEKSWWRELQGDGMTALINPEADTIVYGSGQQSFIWRSENKGETFQLIHQVQDLAADDTPAFNTPYRFVPGAPHLIYLATQHFYKSPDGGDTWEQVTTEKVDGENFTLTMEVSPSDSNLILITTAPDPFFGTGVPKILRSADGGQTWSNTSGSLPNRLIMDVAFDPNNDQVVYAVLSGFQSQHLFKSFDRGLSWQAWGSGLPDIPHNSVTIDPNESDHVYIGNDLGVWFSADGGENWEVFAQGLPEATLAMHLSISRADNKLWVATHGRGAYRTGLVSQISGIREIASEESHLPAKVYPNPATEYSTLEIEFSETAEINVTLIDAAGKIIHQLPKTIISAGLWQNRFELNGLPAGIYYFKISGHGTNTKKKLDSVITLKKVS